MRNYFKTKIVLPIAVSVAIALSILGSVLYFVKSVRADEIVTNQPALVVRKVNTYVNTPDYYIDGSLQTQEYKHNTIPLPDDTSVDVIDYDDIAIGGNDSYRVVSGDTVMLNNANLENSSDPEYKYIKENILVAFNCNETLSGPNPNFNFQTLQINVTLNGSAIHTGEEIIGSDSINRYFYMFLDLTNLQYDNNTPVPLTEIEGLYTFTFTYNRIDANNQTLPQQRTPISFYLINESTYVNNVEETDSKDRDNVAESVKFECIDAQNGYFTINQADGIFGFRQDALGEYRPMFDAEDDLIGYKLLDLEVDSEYPGDRYQRFINYQNQYNNLPKRVLTVNTVEPRFSNTERIDRKSYGSGTQTVEKNYFNYNNISTSDYSGFVSGQDENILSLPSFVYDASKYNVSYTKLLYGTETKVTSSFEIKYESGALNGYLTFRYETNGVVTLGAPIKISVNNDGNYIYEIKFGDIGEYTLNVNYLVRLPENEFVIANQGAINTLLHTDKWNIVGTTKLYNFGYQLYHSNYSGIGNSELEFKNENESLYSDVTFKNSGVTAIQDTNGYSFSNNNYYLNTPVDICSTNQAPVSFKYFANMIQNGVNIVGFYRTYSNYAEYESNRNATNSQELLDSKVKYSLNNNTRFTSNGFYEVFLMYDFQYYERLNDDGVVKTLSSKIPHVQYFAFQISNREPTVTAEVLDEQGDPTNTIVYANGWTNQNVIVTWSPNTVFDVMPRITIEKAVLGNGTSYTTLNPSQYDLNGNQLTLIKGGSVNTNGHYKLTINYGPGNSTRVIYRFTIDYEAITDIKQYALLGEQSNSSAPENTTTYILKDSTDEQILNSAFLFDWSNKRSGAVITANYAYIPLSSGGDIGLNDSYELNDVAGMSTEAIINSINEFDQILMKNGNQLITINEDIPYSKITDSITNTSGLYFTYNMDNSDVNSIRTAAGIYLFKFSDQAGNVAYRSVFVDNSKGVALKRTEGKEEFSLTEDNNVASKNTLLLWGTHKAIRVSGNVLNFMESAKDSSGNHLYSIVNLLKKDYEGDTYLAVGIDNVTFKNKDNNSQKVVTGQKYKLLKIKTDSTNEQNWFNGENIFDIRIYDKSYVIQPPETINDLDGIKENGDLYYKTYKGFRLEMNPDNSLLMAWVYGSYYKDSNGTENTHKRLYSDSNTNRQQVFIEWKTNEGVYDIESIKYDFFPLTFDTTQANFPYSDVASLSGVDIMSSHKASTVNSGKVITTLPINTEFSTYYNTYITIAGKYVVTRTYVNDLDDTDLSGDTKERKYTFYVDRNGIVGYSQSGVLLGQLLSIIMGEGDSGTNFTGAQFLEDSSTNKLTTNKLPVKLYIPLQKFEFPDQYLYLTTKQESTLLKVFGLEYKLKKGYNVMPVIGPINNKNFVNSGVYTLTLSDKSGYYENNNEQNKEPVEYIFSFTIENTLPNGDFVKYYGSDYLILTDDMPSLNSTNVKFVWKEPASPYMARIDKKNLTITSYTPTDPTGTVVFKVENGIDNVNKYGLSIVPITGGQWDWEINLSSLPQDISAKYEIKIQYEGDKSYYDDYGEENFSSEEIIWFDFLQPEYNYTKLIEQDNFLSTLYNKSSTTETKNFIGNFSNAQNNINFENYAFTIDSNYKFTDATTTGNSFWENRHDTYKIYYRQYDKYDETGAGINKQSLIPEDDRYSNLNIDPTRLRFDPDLMINDKNVYTNFVYSSDSSFYQQLLSNLVSDCLNHYYEIIEMDAAGNHRIYTVFLKSEDDLLKLDYYGSDEITTGQPLITIDFLLDYDIIEGTTQIIKRVNATLFDLQDIRYDYMDDLQNGQNATPWINVSVKNNDTGIVNNYILSPIANASFVSLETLMENINTICTPYDFIKGNSWTITFKTELQESYVVEFRSPGKRLEPRIVDYSQSFVISFPYFESQSDVSDSTYLTEFRAYAAINGIIDFTGQQYLLETDSLSRTIVEELVKNSVYTYTFTLSGSNGGDYWFEFVDNFGRLYRRNKIVGITDVLQADLLSSELLNGINYTSSQATIRYQSKLYNMVVEKKIGNDYQPFNKDNFTMNVASNGVASFPLFSSADMASTNTSVVMYRLTFTNSSEQETVWEIAYYSQLAEVTFSNSSSVIENINNSVSDRQIFISFNPNEKLFTTFVTGVLIYKNSNGNSIQENLGQISSGQSFSKIGKYTLSIYNLLGTRTTITFDVKEKVSSYYSVVNIINGVKANYILPSEVAYQNNSDIKHYFTIYEYEIEVDAAKQLKIENVGNPITNTQSGVEVAKTFVYRIYNTNGDINRTIAVTKIKATSNFVRTYGNNLEVNSVIQSGNSIKVAQTGDGIKTATVSVTNGFYLDEGNSIFIDCYYNQQYVGRLTTSELPLKFGMLLSDSGVYDFYFSDLAGNKQVFGNNGYFRIILLNDILFTVNGKQAVDNSVFNGTVIIALQQTGKYTLNTWEFYKNGVRLSNINKVNNTFTFRDYGIYNIKMTGNNGSLVTYFNFRIVNPNEAMPIFEYIGLNNYEIVKVVKDGDDITNTLKERLDVSNIGALAISAFENGVGGAGAYQITVMARYVTRKPDQTFTFNVWINNDTTMIIMSNINPGDSSTSAIKLTLNKRQIYEKVGECVIMFNDVEWLRINASTATENKTEVYTVTENGTYNIKLQTLSGNTLLSFVITKKAPLNAIAIIVIILSVLAVSSIVFIFIKMRKGMRIK